MDTESESESDYEIIYRVDSEDRKVRDESTGGNVEAIEKVIDAKAAVAGGGNDVSEENETLHSCTDDPRLVTTVLDLDKEAHQATEGTLDKAGKSSVGEASKNKMESNGEGQELRRSTRHTKGKHSNPHNLPKSVQEQNTIAQLRNDSKNGSADFEAFGKAVSLLGETLGRTLLNGWNEMSG